MRTLIIISLVVLVGCQDIIDFDDALKLSSYLNTLEQAEQRQQEIMNVENLKIREHLEEKGLPEDPVILELEERLESSAEFSIFIFEWKKAIIENTGGYSPYDELPEGWHKTIDPNEYRPDVGQDSISLVSDNVLMALIELTNKSIAYSSKLYLENQALIKSKEEPNQSALFLAQSIQEGNEKMDGPLFYSFDYYPIDSLEINGKWYYGNEYVEIPREEWDKINQEDLRINLPLKLYWGDTTFQFTSKKQ